MPRKVPFRVIYNTGWEDEYPAKDLEVHSPFVKGWRSPRFCLYPQELVLKIDPPGRIRKLQLLSHQYLIASTVELYVGHFTGDSHMSVEHAKFTRLGYISLSENEASRYKCMELKSVNVDCTGELVKLVLYKNHINELNLYNQVGIVAFNIIADPLTSERGSLSATRTLPAGVLDLLDKGDNNQRLASLIKTYLPGINQAQIGSTNPVLKGGIKPAKISAMDELAFAVAQDPETAEIVRRLERKKETAIEEENFKEAKRLKLVIAELCRAGEILCRYEVEKKQAISREDYDTASEKKDKLDQARQMIYQQLGLHGLLSASGKRSRALSHPPTLTSHLRRRSSQQRSSREEATPTSAARNSGRLKSREDKPRSSLLPPISDSVSPPHKTPKIAADDRPLPTLVKNNQYILAGSNQSAQERSPERRRDEVDWEAEGQGGGGGGDEDVQLEPLTEKQLNQVSLAEEVFGMRVLQQLFAKAFSLREKGLSAVLQVLETKEAGLGRREVSQLVKATCQVLVKGFNDKVFSTFSKTEELLKFMIGLFSESHNLSGQDFSHITEKVVPVLLIKTGDLSHRINEAALELLTVLMRHDKIRDLTLLGPVLVEPFKVKTPSWRLIRARLVLLERLMEDPGYNSSGLTVRTVMEYLVQFLDHSHGEVRDAAIKLCLVLYRLDSTEVRSLMPVPDTPTSRKKTLWKNIFEGFDKIDGVPTPAEREAMDNAAQKAKNEEIQMLQAQVENMRQMVAAATTTGNVTTSPGRNEGGGAEGGGAGDTDTIDKMCVFCGKQQEGLQSDEAIEQHYLHECPMLHSCPHCHQVIEISGLTKHWLTECDAKDKFKECPLCKDAVLMSQFDDHVSSGKCPGGGANSRCPLCHKNIPSGDEGWRTHLMGVAGQPTTCPKKRNTGKLKR